MVLVVPSCLLYVVLSEPCRHALDIVMPGIVSSLIATLEVVMQRQVPSFQTVQKTVEVIQPVPQERIQERITEQVVDIPLPHIMEEMIKVVRSTLQNRCVLRCCAGVDVVQYPFHRARILRAQAIRSQVSSRSVETESSNGLLALFFSDFPFFFFFLIFRARKVQKLPARLISSELRAHQMSPSGVIPHWRSRRALQLVSHVFVSCSEVRRRDMSLSTM